MIFFGKWNGKQCFNDVIIIDLRVNCIYLFVYNKTKTYVFYIESFRLLLCDIMSKRTSIGTFLIAGLVGDKMVIFGGRNMTKRVYIHFIYI